LTTSLVRLILDLVRRTETEVVMLVLSRKEGETVCIAGDIRVTIVEIRGNKVRIGIHAPRDVPIHRQEVSERLTKPGEPAAPEDPDHDPPA
jgi:carbon storage regulator